MDENRKRAYRHLIYWSLIDIRLLCPPYGRASRNPLLIWRRYNASRQAGALADLMHNLAMFSQNDFAGFKEDWFWSEYEQCRQHLPPFSDYKQHFDRELQRLREQGV